MSPATATMSPAQLRIRLVDRIKHLESRLKAIPSNAAASILHNVKTELNTAKRRLKILDERIGQNPLGGSE